MKLAFIGLGVMGYPMAGHLKAAGPEVSVFNRSQEKARRWAEQHGGRAGATIAEAVAGCELVALCVGNDDDVRQVTAEALPAMAEGGVVVDHTTASAKIAREMAEQARASGRWFVDAPVSGGQAGAESGQLTIMLGGADAADGLGVGVDHRRGAPAMLLHPAPRLFRRAVEHRDLVPGGLQVRGHREAHHAQANERQLHLGLLRNGILTGPGHGFATG